MRTLGQITDAARCNETATEDELRLAVCAYDLLLARIEIEKDVRQLYEFIGALERIPGEYLGEANNPHNADAVAWYKAFSCQ